MSKSDYYNRSADRVGNIYFIGDDARVKIGFARDLSARLSAIKTSASHPVRVFYTFTAKAECEPLIHEKFASQRIRGEWFRWDAGMDELQDDIFDYCGPLKDKPLTSRHMRFLLDSLWHEWPEGTKWPIIPESWGPKYG